MKLLEKIIDKKELRNMDKELVLRIIDESKQENAKLHKELEKKDFNERSKEFKEFKKIVRKKLRTIYGMFTNENLSESKKEKLLREKEYEKIMKSHVSTFERIRHYSVLYKVLEKEIGVPRKVVDLGCGYNPFSYPFLSRETEYFCTDISPKEMKFIQEFFEKENLKGKALPLDLTQQDALKIIKKETKNAEWTFMFKLLDTLEAINRGSSKELIKNTKSKFIIISFPTRTISSKNKIDAKRKWFENAAESLKLVNSQEIGSEEYLLYRTNE